MSDARLRELERRWKETGSPDDEAAYLLERVRVGDLTRERLELAAYCGHEGARRSIGMQVLPRSLDDMLSRSLTVDKEASVRLCVAVAEPLLTRLVAAKPHARPLHEAALVAAREWIACPCLSHQVRCQRIVERPPYMPPFSATLMREDWLRDLVASATRSAAGVWPIGVPILIAAHLAGESEPYAEAIDTALSLAVQESSADRVLLELRTNLCPWVLGRTGHSPE